MNESGTPEAILSAERPAVCIKCRGCGWYPCPDHGLPDFRRCEACDGYGRL